MVQDELLFSDEQLEERLIQEYLKEDDSAPIRVLKAALYNRGYTREDIVELAIVALMRRTHAGHLLQDNLN